MEDASLRVNPTASAKSPSSHSSWLMTGSAWDERGSWACCTATQLQPRPCGRLAIDSRTIRISVKLCSIDEMRCRISGASSSSVVRKGFAADADGDIADGGGAAWALPSIQPEIFGATCMQKNKKCPAIPYTSHRRATDKGTNQQPRGARWQTLQRAWRPLPCQDLAVAAELFVTVHGAAAQW